MTIGAEADDVQRVEGGQHGQRDERAGIDIAVGQGRPGCSRNVDTGALEQDRPSRLAGLHIRREQTACGA